MHRVLLFARTHQQAKNFLYDVDPAARRDYVVVLSNRYLHGLRLDESGAAIFLEDWWRDWNPGDANEICMLLNLFYGVKGMWEQSDLRRRALAREQIGLKPPYEPEFMWFDLQVRDRDEDRWLDSSESVTFRTMLHKDATWAGILRCAKRLNALPGLDDRKRTIKPFVDEPIASYFTEVMGFVEAIVEAQGRAKERRD